MIARVRAAWQKARWPVLGPWLALLVLSALLHFWALDMRSFHHDESIHAKLSWDLARHGSYSYDPTYHGPLLYYLTALGYRLFGASDFTARLPIALVGIGMLWWAWKLRRPFGGRAAWWMGLLFSISPLLLYFGRFQRMDLLEIFTATGAFVAFLDVMRKKPRAWIRVGVWTGLAFATKENAYVTAALVAASGALMAVDHGLRKTYSATLEWWREEWGGFVSSIAVFILVTVPLYTVGFTRPDDWFFPGRAVLYWWKQHTIQRVGGPWWFHLPRLAQYEFLVFILAAIWVARRWKRLHKVELFLVIYGVTSILMYIYLGEKVPWLGTHQVWPFVPLAACQLVRSFSPRGCWWSRSLAAVGLALTLVVSLVANFVLEEITPAQERVESLHYVQTSPELVAVAREGLAMDDGSGERVAAVVGEAVWPLTWYWRELPAWWSMPAPGQRPRLVVCDLSKELEVASVLGSGYRRERIPLRVWWLMYETDASARDWLRYFLTRKPWGSVGSSDVMVFRRLDEQRPQRREVEPPAALISELGASRTAVLGRGWLGEVRGVDLAGGRVAAADAGLSRIVVLDDDGAVTVVDSSEELNQPEAVLWWGEEHLLVADTWNHRVLLMGLDGGPVSVLPAPPEGWYGPRALALSPSERLAVADTGHKRVVIFDAQLEHSTTWGGDGADVALDEPVGLAWLDEQRLLICDTGNRRLVVAELGSGTAATVALPEAWSNYYSRPQLTVLDEGRWLLSDPPARSLWLVTGDTGTELRLGDGLAPTGVDYDRTGGQLVLGDMNGAVWIVGLEDGPS